MNKYKNEDFLKGQIMDQNRHLFIYGYPTEQRTIFLKSLEKEYPIKADDVSPMGIYLEDYGIPKIEITNKELTPGRLDIITDEYLSLSIISKILKQMILQDNINVEERLRDLLRLINKYNKLNKYPNANNIRELINLLEESKRMYLSFLKTHAEEGSIENIFDNIPIPFLEATSTVEKIKKSIDNNSYVGLIINHNKSIISSSERAINNLIGGRINSDISVKLASDPNDWETYLTQNNQFIQAIHDYSYVELDDSYKKWRR